MFTLLKGIRVLELSLLAPDLLGMHLADLGAEVIKIEQPPFGDSIRHVGVAKPSPRRRRRVPASIRKRCSAPSLGSLRSKSPTSVRLGESDSGPKMDMPLDGRVVLVTGGSKGIGRAIAIELAQAGARLVICARGAETLAAAADDIRQGGREVEAISADVATPDGARRVLAAAQTRFGRIDVLVNNAGKGSPKPMLDLTEDDWHASFELNFTLHSRSAGTSKMNFAFTEEEERFRDELRSFLAAELPTWWRGMCTD